MSDIVLRRKEQREPQLHFKSGKSVSCSRYVLDTDSPNPDVSLKKQTKPKKTF